MLTIRMQRLGRKGHASYRVVVQDVRQTPTSGKYVAMLGSYDPHTKTNTLVKEKAEFYLSNGAQPSDRVVQLFSAEGIKLPDWVKKPTQHTRTIRNADKLRRNRPPEEKPAEAPVAEEPGSAEEPVADENIDQPAEEAAATESTNEELAAEEATPHTEEPTAESEEPEPETEPEVADSEEPKEEASEEAPEEVSEEPKA